MLRIIRYSLRFETPLLISSSAAHPDFDRVATLDNDGLPYVPGSSVRGRVKDTIREYLLDNESGWSAFRVCNGQRGAPTATSDDYCRGQQGDACSLCRIFGAPGGLMKRGFEFSGAYYPDNDAATLKEAFGEKDLLASPQLIRRARNKRDDILRRAREDYLFVDGIAEALADLEGSVRETPAHQRLSDDIRTLDYRLLLLGLRLTTELGASRNRGYGRCEFLFPDGFDWANEIEDLCAHWKKAAQGGKVP